MIIMMAIVIVMMMMMMMMVCNNHNTNVHVSACARWWARRCVLTCECVRACACVLVHVRACGVYARGRQEVIGRDEVSAWWGGLGRLATATKGV
jgi:hypothetical protein